MLKKHLVDPIISFQHRGTEIWGFTESFDWKMKMVRNTPFMNLINSLQLYNHYRKGFNRYKKSGRIFSEGGFSPVIISTKLTLSDLFFWGDLKQFPLWLIHNGIFFSALRIN